MCKYTIEQAVKDLEFVIEAEPAGAVCPYEFALFQEPQTLVTHS